MPTRLIREGWIESTAVDQLDAAAERFFLRLLLKADDFGRYTANPVTLKNTLYPLKDDVRATDSSRWLAACEKAGLVRCFETPKGRFLEIPKFGQRLRARVSRWPSPDDGPASCPTSDGHLPDICQSDGGHESYGGPLESRVESRESDARVESRPAREAPAACPTSDGHGDELERRRRFAPPTTEEVALHCAKIGLPESEGDKFLAYYHANGWRVGRNPMRSWPHALANWKTNWIERNAHTRNPAPASAGAHRPAVASNLAERLNGPPDTWEEAGDEPPVGQSGVA